MPNKPKLKTKYENDDPDYSPGPSRNQPNHSPSDDSSMNETFDSVTNISSNESSPDKTINLTDNESINLEKSDDIDRTISQQAENVDHTTSQSERAFTDQPKTSNPLILENRQSNMPLTEDDITRITTTICQQLMKPKNSSNPKINLPQLTTNNYMEWANKLRSALKFNNLWIDPTKNVATINEEEKVINRRAAYYLAIHLDRSNGSFITPENEENFIEIWNSIKDFHRPRTATVLTDIYSKLQKIQHTSGQSVEEHLMKIETQFARFSEANQTLQEPHKVALILASVIDSPDFKNVFDLAMWEDESSLTVSKVKSVLITTAKRSSYTDEAHAIDKYKVEQSSSTNRTNNNPRAYDSFACPSCRMDNHLYENCFRRKFNFKRKQNKATGRKPKSNFVDEQNNSDQNEVAHSAHALAGNHHHYKPLNNYRLQPRKSPYHNILPNKTRSAEEDEDVLRLHYTPDHLYGMSITDTDDEHTENNGKINVVKDHTLTNTFIQQKYYSKSTIGSTNMIMNMLNRNNK